MTNLDRLESHAASHRKWLAHFGPEHSAKWEELYRSQREPALFEACVRALLARHVESIVPNDRLGVGGPDFLCAARGERFYVEATCILQDIATKATGLPAEFSPDGGPRTHGHLTRQILNEAVGKAKQCADLDAPCLLAAGTFHFWASAVCCDELFGDFVLTSPTGISGHVDEAGDPVGEPFHSTDLRSSSVARHDDGQIISRRRSISGFLLCGLGVAEWKATGFLHPDPVRRFDRRLLPKIPFRELAPEYVEGKFLVVDA